MKNLKEFKIFRNISKLTLKAAKTNHKFKNYLKNILKIENKIQ